MGENAMGGYAGPPSVYSGGSGSGRGQSGTYSGTDTPQGTTGQAPIATEGPESYDPGKDLTGIPDLALKYNIGGRADPNSMIQVVTSGGHKMTLNKFAAPYLQGFVEDLEREGVFGGSVREGDIWSYVNKNIGGGGKPSEHAFGNAIDVTQTDRGRAARLQAWVEAHPKRYQELLQKWHIYSGARFGDFGHFEWGGVPFSKEEMRKLGLTKEGGPKTSSAAPPPPSPPPPVKSSFLVPARPSVPNINVNLALSGPPGSKATASMTSDSDELFDVDRITRGIIGATA
jgi:hypothetical protein